MAREQHVPIRNRLTQVLGIAHPILLAPMDLVSGRRLAAAVTHAGDAHQGARAFCEKQGKRAVMADTELRTMERRSALSLCVIGRHHSI